MEAFLRSFQGKNKGPALKLLKNAGRIPFLILSFFGLVFLGLLVEAQNKNLLLGIWEIRVQRGGLKGGVKTFPKGNGNTLDFRTSEYKHLFNGKVMDKGSYNLVQKKAFQTRKIETFIQYKKDISPIQFFYIRKDSLFLQMDAEDGISYIYIRVK